MPNHSINHAIILRNIIEADLPIFFEQQYDPEANQMAAFPAREREAFMAHWEKIMREENVALKTILFEGRVAGNIVSWEQSGEREVGYWLGKEYWGQGIATTALTEFLGCVKMRPLYAHVAKHNAASLRVLQKCGFAVCGEARFLEDDGGGEIKEIKEFILKLE
jgi:RimJ/RimL family protein N-acetyltransferase